MAAEKVAGAARLVEKVVAVAAALSETEASEKAVRAAKKKAKADAAPKKVKAAAPTPTPAAPAPAAEAAPPAEAAPAASSGGEVTPKTIKQLHDETGAGMMDCKKALLECDGDQSIAADYLQTKGLATADKKASRVAAEGRIAISNDGGWRQSRHGGS
jgi:elongation factor Ts